MITILIPLYNGIEYLPEAIQSILSQTYTSWKLLIGINGHGDTGGDIAIRLRTGTSNSNSSNLGTFALPGPLTLKKYINQTLTISTGENLYVDIIRIGNSVTGAGFGFTISYFTS